MRIVLASGSPRRKELLEREGIDFVVCSADVDESLDEDLASRPHDAACCLADRKAGAVARLEAKRMEANLPETPDEEVYVIGSDTMVVLEGRIFGKPEDDADAARMLGELSGKTHEVISGVSVWRVYRNADGTVECEDLAFEETSLVTFKELSRQDILDYIACGESSDKAGAYAVQGEGARLIRRFEGDYDNIVGLPVKALIERFPCLLGE